MLTYLGSLFFLDGKYLNSTVATRTAEAIAPLDDRSRFTLALCHIILNHPESARPELEKLAAADPREPRYPYWLGRLDYDAMRFRAAAANLRKALELDPNFMKA